MSTGKKVHIATLGCSKNEYDSSILAGLLEKQGLKLTADPTESDVVIINTCGFITPAKEESVEAILEAGKLKKEGKIKKVLVVGCLSARYREELMQEIPEVDAFFGTEDYLNVLKNLQLQLNEQKDFYESRHLSPGSHTAFVKIAEGCNHTCAFCAIPLIRGKHKSRPMEAILDEARILADKGVKELIIISQDTTFYGMDLYGKQMLVPLLRKLEEIEGLHWIRLHYLYPTTVPDGLMEMMGEGGKLLPYLDIPIQHITDRMLAIMKRGGTRKQIEKLLEDFRTGVPDLTIRTTVITGHPGETEEDFQELLQFIADFGFDRLGVFPYSHEEGTAAWELGDPIPEAVKEERARAIMEIQRDISFRKNQDRIGSVMEILVDEILEEDSLIIGRSRMDSPEIDNQVIIQEGSVNNIRPGQFIQAEIVDAEDYDLFGRMIS